MITQAGPFPATPDGVRAFAATLARSDQVALEATGSALADIDDE